MGHSLLITLVLTTIHLPTILSITTTIERNAPKNFRRHIGLPAPPTDWENGLREAVHQMLIREGYSHPNLQEYLSIAPILGQRSTATPFGDVAVLARGQLYLTNAGFTFIQDPNGYDCDDCDEREICGATSCRWSKPQNYGTLLALWTARRIRHRDRYYGHRYEVQYTISPVYSTSRPFIAKNGIFNYNIAGHVFATKDSALPQHQTLTERDCNHCNHHENYVARTYSPATYRNHKNDDRRYLPPHMTVMEINPARLKGGFLIGLNPNGDKYVLKSLPDQGETPGYREEASVKNNLQKEVELYTRLLQSLARKTESSEHITTTLPTTTQFAPNTMPMFVTNPISSTGAFQEIPSTSDQKLTAPYQRNNAADLAKRPKTSTTRRFMRPTTPSTQLFSKTTTVIRFPMRQTEKAMTRSTTPFRPSPNYVRYSEPDPLYHPMTMPMYTTSGRFSSVLSKTTKRVQVTTAKPSATTSPRFSNTEHQTRPTTSAASASETNENQSGLFYETKRPQEKSTGRQLLPAEVTTIPNYQIGVTSALSEDDKTPRTVWSNYEVTEAMKREQDTTTESKVIFDEDETHTVFIEDTPTTRKVLIAEETQRNLSTPHVNIDESKQEVTTVIADSGELIQTQETQETPSIPHTTMNVNNNDQTEYELTTLNDEKNLNTLATITFFDVEETDDFSKELSTPRHTTTYTTQSEDEKHTTLPTTFESTTVGEPEVQSQPSVHETTENFTTETPTVINFKIPMSAEVTTTDVIIAKTEKEVDLLDEIFGTVVTERVLKRTTMTPTTGHKNTKEIDELFDDDVLLKGEDDSDTEATTKEYVKIIFSNFYLASSDEPTTETITDTPSYTQETEQESSEITTENEGTTEHTTQSVTIPTSQSYSTSISFEVNKRNKSRDINPEMDENVKARLTEITLNNTEYMIYKAELPGKKAVLQDGTEISASNTSDAIALMLVNHARSIDYINKKHNETKPKRKHRKSKHRYQKKIT